MMAEKYYWWFGGLYSAVRDMLSKGISVYTQLCNSDIPSKMLDEVAAQLTQQ